MSQRIPDIRPSWAPLDGARGALALTRAVTRVSERPDRPVRALLAAASQPLGLLAGIRAAVARYPRAIAVATPDEQVSYEDLWSGARSIAAGLAAAGVTAQSRVGILALNSAMYVRLVLAGAMLGADLVFLNTGFGPEALRATLASEDVDVVLIDDRLAQAPLDTTTFRTAELAAMMLERAPRRLPRAKSQSRLVILTSGTTGRPKGAARPSDAGGGMTSIGSVLGPIPLRLRDTVVIPAPFFHGWGLGTMLLSLGLCATIVTDPQFDPDRSLAALEHWRARVLVLVPTMLGRICALAPERLARADTDALRIIASCGSAIPQRLVIETLDRFGPVLYNVYGSTEVAIATVATPADLRAEPTTAGRPAPGICVAILDDRGVEVDPGQVGRVFVASASGFDGYTGGGSKEAVRGMLSTGDVGHFDRRGRLFVDGREDDMIVSGAENVYPREIEDLLSGHDAVQEAAVIGVPDDRFGQALKAFVVLEPGASVDAEELKRYVALGAARFKVPRSFVFLPELPRNATGKLLRRELA